MSYYFLCNDDISYDGNIKDHDSVFIGVGNYGWFQALYEAIVVGNKFKSLTALDSNPSQLEFFKKVYNYILKSNTREEFIGNLFCGVFVNDKLTVDVDKFRAIYGLNAYIHKYGVVIDDDNLVGGFSKYIASPLSMKLKRSEGLYVFSAGYNHHFLSSDDSFNAFKVAINNIPINIIEQPIEKCIQSALLDDMYLHNVVWVSNLFSKYFMDKNTKLTEVYNLMESYSIQVAPKFPEMRITIMRDQRKKIAISESFGNSYRIMSVHTKAFYKVAKYMIGKNNVEVTNVQRWINNQKGISKLNRCVMMHPKEFKSSAMLFDTVVFHILVGHGMVKKDFLLLCKIACNKCKRLIILEHNSESPDFKGKNIGLSSSELSSLSPIKQEFVGGVSCSDRNHVFVIKGDK